MDILFLTLRVIVFAAGLLAYWLEISSDWFIGARKKTEYVRQGVCKRCGRCCRCLALIVPKGIGKHHFLVKVARVWHAAAMNFKFVSEEEDWLVYRCNYYRAGAGDDPGHCSIYPFRHRLCRFFPRQGLYGHPSVHADCGFKFIKRTVLEKISDQRRLGHKPFSEFVASSEQTTKTTLSA